MRGPLADWFYAALARVRRVERREVREFRRWLERTSNIVHLSVLVFVPLLIGVVTALSNSLESISFLLFPPLASGTYMLFGNPESEYASPSRFVAGLTVGALCGWAALEVGAVVGLQEPSGAMQANAAEAALAMFLTAVVTWPLDVEEASAYSTALLGLLVPPNKEAAFAASVFLATTIVASVFYVWREQFYECRAEFLYESVRGDDHVLVPMRGENPDATAMLGARLAAAHDAGKVVLLDIVGDEDIARAERELLDDRRRADRAAATDGGRPAGDSDTSPVGKTDGGPAADDADAPDGAGVDGDGDEQSDRDGNGEPPGAATGTDLEDVAAEQAVSEAATHLEMRAAEIETQVGIPCQVVVAVDGRSPARTVLTTAREVNCDLVAASYEQRHGGLSPYLRSLFRGDRDVLVHRSKAGRTRWKRFLVTVRRASDVAHGMVDFATRLAGRSGRISVETSITGERERERRRAEEMLADIVEPFDGRFETRVSTTPIERYLAENADDFDLVVMGASRDRSAASRLISPPTFERIQDVDADVAVVDRS
ncbi:MAG: HPP family protein [Haloarculaceae archaeon]